MSVLVLILVSMLFAGARSDAAETQGAGKGTSTAELLRQDILRFVGPTTAGAEIPVAQDGFLVRLNRKAAGNELPSQYGMVVRGMDPIEQALLQDAQDGKWDHFDLFRAALIVEGIRDEEVIRRYEARLDAVLAEAYAKLQAEGKAVTPDRLTRELFETLHRDLLTKNYNIDCTHLARVLETGHFNCVSATVLFNALASKAGLDVVALEMPGHALSRVRFTDEAGREQSMNLETTAPNWFALQSEKARNQATMHHVARPIRAESLPATGNPESTDVPSTDTLSKKLREITPVQLIATIYYNQGVDLLAQDRFAEAAQANIKALHLDPSSETAWGNLMATFNNWAIKLATDSKRYDLAATLLDQGVYLDPNYDKFPSNQLHIYYHWIRDLAMENRIADAQTVFAIADQRLPGDKDLDHLMRAVLKK